MPLSHSFLVSLCSLLTAFCRAIVLLGVEEGGRGFWWSHPEGVGRAVVWACWTVLLGVLWASGPGSGAHWPVCGRCGSPGAPVLWCRRWWARSSVLEWLRSPSSLSLKLRWSFVFSWGCCMESAFNLDLPSASVGGIISSLKYRFWTKMSSWLHLPCFNKDLLSLVLCWTNGSTQFGFRQITTVFPVLLP